MILKINSDCRFMCGYRKKKKKQKQYDVLSGALGMPPNAHVALCCKEASWRPSMQSSERREGKEREKNSRSFRLLIHWLDS